MSRLGDDYVPPTNVNPNDLPFSYQWILSVLNKAISKKIMDLESFEFSDVASTVHSWWQYCVIFVLKQLSFSLLGVIKSLSLRGVFLKTHFGYILTMGCDCFILYAICYRKNMAAAFFIKGPYSDRINYDMQVPINFRGNFSFLIWKRKCNALIS